MTIGCEYKRKNKNLVKMRKEFLMDKKELLQKYYDMEMNNVFAYSSNYLMSSPKKGYEREWCESNERATLLLELIRE